MIVSSFFVGSCVGSIVFIGTFFSHPDINIDNIATVELSLTNLYILSPPLIVNYFLGINNNNILRNIPSLISMDHMNLVFLLKQKYHDNTKNASLNSF
jgi:hypothetical protein